MTPVLVLLDVYLVSIVRVLAKDGAFAGIVLCLHVLGNI